MKLGARWCVIGQRRTPLWIQVSEALALNQMFWSMRWLDKLGDITHQTELGVDSIMPIYLHGLALQNYRGIGPELQRLGPFKEFNFFIGANNAGKSTVLNFISRHLPLPSTQTHSSRRSNDIEP